MFSSRMEKQNYGIEQSMNICFSFDCTNSGIEHIDIHRITNDNRRGIAISPC